MKIVVIFPTVSEAKYFKNSSVDVRFCGVGVISAAYHTHKALCELKPDVAIMAGIAGVYPGSDLKIGETVLVSRERIADLGFFYEEGFREFNDMRFDMDFDATQEVDCPYLLPDMPFKTAVSNTMNSAMSPYVRTEGVDVENMEGASFFYVCNKENIRFFELRSISNVVDVKHEAWDYEGSISNMTAALNQLIHYLRNEDKH